MKWFKFYGQDWLTDTKIINMSMEDRLCFLTLLCLASAEDKGGIIPNCTEETLIELTRIPEDIFHEINPRERAMGCLQRFIDNNMITVDNFGVLSVTNFNKRQGKNLSGYERIKRYRERKKAIKNKGKTGTPLITKDNVRDNANDNARIDKNRIDKNNIVEQSSTPFSFKEKLDRIWEGNRKDLKIIARYFSLKGFSYDNELQYQSALKRELKPAKMLLGYTAQQIDTAVEYCKKNYPDIWTLETLHKVIDKTK